MTRTYASLQAIIEDLLEDREEVETLENYLTISADYTTTATDQILNVTTTTSITITLATVACEAGKFYTIKDKTGGAGTYPITIATQGAETIDGAATFTINTNYGAIEVFSDGTNWFIR